MTGVFLQIRVIPGASPWSSLPLPLLTASRLRLLRRPRVTEVCDDLLKLFGSVSDGRSGQGRDHPVAAVLALAAAAVVAGMKGYTAIAGWVKDVPPPVLADLYLRAGASPARPPSKATIWRVVTDADADAFDATVGSWLMSSLLGEPAARGAAGG